MFDDNSVPPTQSIEVEFATSCVNPFWNPVQTNGMGLPKEPGVYRFLVPVENQPEEHIEFLAQLRWRKHGVHHILMPTFEYVLDDEFITVPEGTHWRERLAGDPDELGPTQLPIVAEMALGIPLCPFCHQRPMIDGEKIKEDDGDRYYTRIPYKFNRFWFTCCEWIAKTPRPCITQLKNDWSQRKHGMRQSSPENQQQASMMFASKQEG